MTRRSVTKVPSNLAAGSIPACHLEDASVLTLSVLGAILVESGESEFVGANIDVLQKGLTLAKSSIG